MSLLLGLGLVVGLSAAGPTAVAAAASRGRASGRTPPASVAPVSVVVNALTADPTDPVDTGIQVTPGQTYNIGASGSTDYCDSPGLSCPSGPAGKTNPYGFGCGSPPDQCPIPSALLGTLVGQIGSGPYFVVGGYDALTAGPSDSGELYLLYNDVPGYYGDNSGSYEALISSGPVVRVPATQAFTSTGITLTKGEVFSVDATGTPSYRPGSTAGPKGVAFKKGTCAAAQSAHHFTAPGLRCWSLIGRIGTTGVIFYVGPSFHLQAPVAGALYFGFNDSIYSDNSGAFVAAINPALSNGSFEQPVLPAGTWSTECGTAIPAWVIGGGCVDLNTGGAATGNQWIDLNDSESSPPGSMTQALPLSAGTYSLHFAFSGNSTGACGGQGIKTMTLLVDGRQIGTYSFDTSGGQSNWIQEHPDFTVSSRKQPTTIEFLSTTQENCAGPAIDSVLLVDLG